MKTIIEKSSGNKYTKEQLLQFRKEAVDAVDVWRLQDVNNLLARYARKYKLDYYSI